jgi:hypothetical protein
MDQFVALDTFSGSRPAGTLAPAGRYRRIDVPWGKLIQLDREDRLPASLDGHVALYEPVTLLYSARAASAN